jgi:uncharacterized protein YukJ
VPLERYGVLKATILDRRRATDRDAHYHVLCGVGTARWRLAINARADNAPAEVAHATLTRFAHPILARLEQLHEGWRPVKGQDGLDYLRGNLCRPEQFKPLPIDKPGANNDLNELFDAHLRRNARIYAFGEPWGPDDAKDPYFGFEHGRGLHDVHQNQGNLRQFRRDDGVWQDGGLIAGAPDGTWTAIFLRFQSQAWSTDDASGHTKGVLPR